MKSRFVIITIITTFLIACQTVPITHRKQLSLLPESQMIGMSLTNYQEFLQQHPVSKNQKDQKLVEKVGDKIANAVTQFMKSKHLGKRIKDYQWEFNLVNENIPNAWCMPGGKVVVYAGILPYTRTEAGLAVVMGHEIAHAIARHGNERMSQSMILQMGGMALSSALDSKPQQTKAIFMGAYGVGTKVGLSLPFSRTHETEADKLGLVFMAMAGYNPEEAITFWERMSQSGGQKPPELLSTHPSDETRIKDLKEFLPEAMKYYNKANK
jgi:predicted Zn-dependent protease